MSGIQYLERDEMQKLVALLREIPELVEDLAVAITAGSYRSISYEPRVSVGEKEFPLPFNPSASEAADELHDCLSGWVDRVVEQRQVRYEGHVTLLGLSRWLDRHMIDLSLTEGSGVALGEIQLAMRRARRCVASKPKKPTYGSLAEARSAELNAAAIERLRIELGPEYQGLTQRRIETLLKRGRITPLRTFPTPDGEMSVYLLGAVLDAHLTHPTRKAKTA
jgi:hypothetical protein